MNIQVYGNREVLGGNISGIQQSNAWSPNYIASLASIEGIAYMNGENDGGCQKLIGGSQGIGRDACLPSQSTAEDDRFRAGRLTFSFASRW